MIERFGWTEELERESSALVATPGLEPARVIAEFKGGYLVVSRQGEATARALRRLLDPKRPDIRPIVGDWVLVKPGSRQEHAMIHAVLPRRTRLVRRAAGEAEAEQPLVANVDAVLLIMGLDPDFNLRRLERYLITVRAARIEPVIVLTKADLFDDADELLDEARRAAGGADCHAVSAIDGTGIAALRARLLPGRTYALLGSSGAGKSTLLNCLIGEERMATAETRDDGRGRHTTTHRQLVLLPFGALLIDNPGLREIQLWEADEGHADTFDDIQALAASCRFRDCRHETEPGCAVQAAIESDELDSERLENYRRTLTEIREREQRRRHQGGPPRKRR